MKSVLTGIEYMFRSLTPIILLLFLAQLYLLPGYETWKLLDVLFLIRDGIKITQKF